MANNKEFFEKLYWCAPANMHGIYVSVMLAQSALESGYGKSELTKKYNNYFGILADKSWTGKKITFTNGFTYRVYESAMESVQDYINFLLKNSRYKKEGVFNAASPEEQANALQNAGYAGTTTTYAGKIISIINTYNLTQYDKKKRRKRVIVISLFAGLVLFTFKYLSSKKS